MPTKVEKYVPGVMIHSEAIYWILDDFKLFWEEKVQYLTESLIKPYLR
jgi:hypothetical protein